MRRTIRLLVISMLVTVFASSTVFGMSYSPSEYTSANEVSALLSSNVKQGRVTESTKTRGEFFMGAGLVVRNNGNGTTGVLAIAFASIPVGETYISTYLDQWDEKAERRRRVDYYEAESYSKDYPEGLKTPTIDVSLIN